MKKRISTFLDKLHPIIGDPQNFSELIERFNERFFVILVSVHGWVAVDQTLDFGVRFLQFFSETFVDQKIDLVLISIELKDALRKVETYEIKEIAQ